MKQHGGASQNRVFVVAFLILTLFCWCPLGYGPHGPVGRVLGIPSWTVWAYVFALVLFGLECVYLFRTGLAVDDGELADIVSQLQTFDSDESASDKEAE